jgi:hypothetical protein
MKVPPATITVQRYTRTEIEAARQVLEASGYVVVARERVKTVAPEALIDDTCLTDAKYGDSLVAHTKAMLSEKLGHDLCEVGAIIWTSERPTPQHPWAHRLEISVTVIMPERAK